MRGWHYIADDLEHLDDWYAAEAASVWPWLRVWS